MSEKREEAGPEVPFGRLQMYRVLVLNDDEHTYSDVVESLVEVAKMSVPKAVKTTKAIDKQGRAVVAVAHLELAELICERFAAKGLQTLREKIKETDA